MILHIHVELEQHLTCLSGSLAASSWIFGYVVVQVTPSGIASLGKYFYLIWAGLVSNNVLRLGRAQITDNGCALDQNAIMMAVVYFYYPETANMTLESVDLIFVEDYRGWRSAVKKSIAMHRTARASASGRKDLETLHLSTMESELVPQDVREDSLKIE